MPAKFAPDVYVRLRETGMSNRQIADQLGVDEASVRRGLNKAGYKPFLLPPHFLSNAAVVLEKPLRIDIAEFGPGAITADWHVPLTDYPLVNTFLDHAQEVGARWLGVAGDWWNQDFWSTFDFKQPGADVPTELRHSNEVIRKALEVFEFIVISYGNHDGRLVKTVKYAVDFAQTMRWLFSDLEPELLKRVHISNLDYFMVDTPLGPYRVVHPRAYSSVPLTTPRRLASKYLTHVITGHAHHAALGKDVSGKFTVAEIGGFFDPDKTMYVQRSTPYPNWTRGYGFIDADGYLTVEAEGWSSRVGRRL